MLIAVPLTQPAFDWLAARVPSLRDLAVGQNMWGALITVVIVSGLMLLGGQRAARRAGRVSAIEALRAPVDPKTRMSIGRWVIAGVGCLATIGLAGGLQIVGIVGIGQNGLFVGLALSIVLAALAPLLLGPVLGLWTGLIPARASAGWFLARNACRYRIGQSTSAVVPLTIGLILIGPFTSVFSMFVSAQTATGGGGAQMDGEANLIIFGAPLVLATVAAVVTVFMSGRAREREFALISAAGGTPRLVVRTAVLEAIIYAVTALILGLVVTVATSIVVWISFARVAPRTVLAVEVVPMLILFGIGLIGLLAATVIPTALSVRMSVREALAA